MKAVINKPWPAWPLGLGAYSSSKVDVKSASVELKRAVGSIGKVAFTASSNMYPLYIVVPIV